MQGPRLRTQYHLSVLRCSWFLINVGLRTLQEQSLYHSRPTRRSPLSVHHRNRRLNLVRTMRATAKHPALSVDQGRKTDSPRTRAFRK